LRIFFYGGSPVPEDADTESRTFMRRDAPAFAQLVYGLQKSLKDENMGEYAKDIEYLDESTLLDIIIK